MARPTEEDLGIAETSEEQEIASRPLTTVEDDDVPRDDDERPQQIAAPETDEAKAARERDAAGKFVAKPKADTVAPADKPADGVKPPVPPPGFVDQRALHEARAQNKVLEERFNTLMEVVNKRNQAQPEPKPEAPVIPDKNTDPLGYIDYIESRLGKIEGESAAQAQAREASAREQHEFQQAMTIAKPQYDEAMAADPTLEPTRVALFDSYANEIAVLNRTNPEYQRNPREFLSKALTKLEQDHIKFAVSSGQNVGPYLLDLAKARGITVQPVQSAPAPTPAPKTIAQRQAAQDRHLSIGDLPGSAAPGTVSAKDLVKMSPKQFADFAKKMGDAGMDEIFGKA